MSPFTLKGDLEGFAILYFYSESHLAFDQIKCVAVLAL
jgi:hypothetical protein